VTRARRDSERVSKRRVLRCRSSNTEFPIGVVCDPGTIVLVNDGVRNSDYTETLFRHLPDPGRLLEDLMKEVR
jgi:hypothetical protein